MAGTLLLAIYGACTGTVGVIAGLANRLDALWGRRARSRDLRTSLEPVRDVLSEAKAAPQRAASVTGNLQFRAHVQEIGEAVRRCSDRKMRAHLKKVNVRCLQVINSASTVQDDHVPYAVTSAIESALTATSDALARLERIDRRAPS